MSKYEGEDELFDKVERIVRPIILKSASKFMGVLDMTTDEAIQEARYALMLALRKYDYNTSRGGIFTFAKLSVRNHFLKRVKHHVALCRMSHDTEEGDDGQEKVVRRHRPLEYVEEPDSLDTRGGARSAVNSGSLGQMPNARLNTADSIRCSAEFCCRLEARLGDRERAVLKCRTNPSMDLHMLMIADGEPEATVPMIGSLLGLTKNQTDWALKKIRDEASSLLRLKEFDGFGDSYAAELT